MNDRTSYHGWKDIADYIFYNIVNDSTNDISLSDNKMYTYLYMIKKSQIMSLSENNISNDTSRNVLLLSLMSTEFQSLVLA